MKVEVETRVEGFDPFNSRSGPARMYWSVMVNGREVARCHANAEAALIAGLLEDYYAPWAWSTGRGIRWEAVLLCRRLARRAQSWMAP